MPSRKIGTPPACPPAWRRLVPALARGDHLPLLHAVAALRTQGVRVFPPQERIFAALDCTPPEKVRVVILGQDPYHGAGQAHGLAFSVPAHMPCPRSLSNIFKEIHKDIGEQHPLGVSSEAQERDLTRWARQGVLLLNTVLTVEEGKAHSHAHLGWQALTAALLEAVACGPRPVAALLWGKFAQGYAPLFQEQGKHLVLLAAHPSPLSASRGFFGCRHFSQVNIWLKKHGEAPVLW